MKALENWYNNITPSQRTFIWMLSILLVLLYGVGFIPLALLIWIKLGSVTIKQDDVIRILLKTVIIFVIIIPALILVDMMKRGYIINKITDGSTTSVFLAYLLLFTVVSFAIRSVVKYKPHKDIIENKDSRALNADSSGNQSVEMENCRFCGQELRIPSSQYDRNGEATVTCPKCGKSSAYP